MDILWTNCNSPTAMPRYDLLFLKYANFRNGAQQPNSIIGTDALGAYLIGLGFTAQDTHNWIEEVHTKNVAFIPNVMMPEKHLADYGL